VQRISGSEIAACFMVRRKLWNFLLYHIVVREDTSVTEIMGDVKELQSRIIRAEDQLLLFSCFNRSSGCAGVNRGVVSGSERLTLPAYRGWARRSVSKSSVLACSLAMA
jgi:hypothetical protein